jgi:hypothetical protein
MRAQNRLRFFRASESGDLGQTSRMPYDPVLIAYSAKRGRSGKRTYWTRIGAAYPHETGAGLTIVFDALPLDKRVFLLEPQAATE